MMLYLKKVIDLNSYHHEVVPVAPWLADGA